MPGVLRPRLERTRREAALAHSLRLQLVERLGGVCAGCGDFTTPLLEVDHRDGRLWKPEKLSQIGRARRYWQEFERGVPLRVLCRSCNARDGGGRRYA